MSQASYEVSDFGTTKYGDDRLQMSFEAKYHKRHLKCHFGNFMDGKPLEADIVLDQPPMDSMVIATPWPEKHAFEGRRPARVQAQQQ